MPTVSMPAEFFRGELRLYDDWRLALARELLQNSVDAGATRVEATFTTHTRTDGTNVARVEFTDDGTGMDRRVLEQVFFALGRTTKTAADTVGGFGRARILVCFAQQSYTIRTQDLLVRGTGGEYEIVDADRFVPGATFTIDTLDADPQHLRRAFVRLLGACDLAVPVYIDGELAQGPSTPGRARRVLRDENNSPWGSAYVRENGVGRLVVRVRGLEMFTRWINGSDDVVLELRPTRSREVLAASRDGLVGDFATQLDQFVSQLATNRRQALRPEPTPIRSLVYGGGLMVSAPATAPAAPAVGAAHGHDAAPAAPASGEAGDGDASGAGESGTSTVEVSGTGIGARRPARLVSGELPAAAYSRPTGHPEEFADAQHDLGFDMYLLADASTALTRRLAKDWNPASWAAGSRRRNLALTWRAAVQVALDALLAAHPSVGAVAWTVGWTFDEGVEASHASFGDAHVFSLNPTGTTTRIAYKVSDRADRNKLLAVAAHEVAHVVAGEHDERFANALTDIYAAIDHRTAAAVLAAAARGSH